MSGPMQIPSSQISYKKKVGKLNGNEVLEIGMKGGLHLIVVAKDGKAEIASCGPHRAVARYIAKKREPDIQFTDLNKSDDIELVHFQFCLDKYEALTEAFRAEAKGNYSWLILSRATSLSYLTIRLALM
jgi:hypothetical protein